MTTNQKIFVFSLMGGVTSQLPLSYLLSFGFGSFPFFFLFPIGVFSGAISGLINIRLSKGKVSFAMSYFLALIESIFAFFCVWILSI